MTSARVEITWRRTDALFAGPPAAACAAGPCYLHTARAMELMPQGFVAAQPQCVACTKLHTWCCRPRLHAQSEFLRFSMYQSHVHRFPSARWVSTSATKLCTRQPRREGRVSRRGCRCSRPPPSPRSACPRPFTSTASPSTCQRFLISRTIACSPRVEPRTSRPLSTSGTRALLHYPALPCLLVGSSRSARRALSRWTPPAPVRWTPPSPTSCSSPPPRIPMAARPLSQWSV
jgi:hypothetical protein